MRQLPLPPMAELMGPKQMEQLPRYLFRLVEEMNNMLGELSGGKIGVPVQEEHTSDTGVSELRGLIIQTEKDLTSEIGRVSASLQTLSKQVDGINTRLTELEGKVQTDIGALAALEGRVKALEDAQQPAPPTT